MLFAAKIQKDSFLQVSQLQPQQKKDLCLTNFSLDEFESMAAIYLSTKQAKSMLIVCLERPQLSAYHTSITISHRQLSHCKIQSRNGDVFVIGSEEKVSAHREETTNKQRQQHRQERRQKRSIQSTKMPIKSTEKRQQQTPALTQPVRQSSRVRTTTVPQPTPPKTSKKSSSSSKGKSLLDMMNNLDEDDDEESSYSEQDGGSDSSSDESSSEQQDDLKTKKSTITEKIRRKSMPTKDKQTSEKGTNGKERRKSESSDGQQEKSKEEREIDNKQEMIKTPSSKDQEKQLKPFNYVIPTRLPEFLSKK